MQFRKWVAAAAVSAAAALGSSSGAAEPVPSGKAVYTFGSLKTAPVEAAKAKAADWLKAAGRFDAPAFDQIWANDARSVFDRTIDTYVLGSPEAAALLAQARQPDAPPPTELPAVLKDAKSDPGFRANLATAYAKALAGKRIYEEALEALRGVRPEEAVDPGAYFFYRAVTEHALIQKDAASISVARLLDDVVDLPDRYRVVATLMLFDMQAWSKDAKDLANIGRLMDNSGRRLDLARGGPQTQEIQKKILFRLDEAIKEMENQATKPGNCNGGQCPNGGQPKSGDNITPNGPAADSVIMGGGGKGTVDEKRLRKLSEEWGKLPAAERAKAVQEITRDLPPKYRPMIEEYFKSLNRLNGVQP